MRLALIALAVICAVIAAVIGFDLIQPDNAKDAENWYRGLVALALVFGFGSTAA